MDFSDREDLKLLTKRFVYLRQSAEKKPTTNGAAGQSACYSRAVASLPEARSRNEHARVEQK